MDSCIVFVEFQSYHEMLTLRLLDLPLFTFGLLAFSRYIATILC